MSPDCREKARIKRVLPSQTPATKTESLQIRLQTLVSVSKQKSAVIFASSLGCEVPGRLDHVQVREEDSERRLALEDLAVMLMYMYMCMCIYIYIYTYIILERSTETMQRSALWSIWQVR